ncbi:hydroxymethylglutaryl-CoA reductase [Leuconostoc holzapfelii]|uniref:Hydroxymethylglutaryl-CoA reductase n=1 Tax=Leuconostoc holzapfelii TaxID=434464 RepID=A0A846ZFD9_9LACO|nr:hydroxymethylglutaryl-CoA reductase [Leuconostoc holzapfelii]NKZ18874.1 hydroxymethylglutaryl-CoA reductase [Leuconostoc holzapfelii]
MHKKFYELTPDERLASLKLTPAAQQAWQHEQSALNAQIVENYISDFRVPTGLLHDIVVAGQRVTVPMATEEPSVIAAANHGAKMLNAGGGVAVTLPERTALIGQLLFSDVSAAAIEKFVNAQQTVFFSVAKQAKPSIYRRGGGLLSVVARTVSETMVSVDFTIDTKDAMGANIVNTILEAEQAVFSDFQTHFVGAILSNYATAQCVTVTGQVPISLVGGPVVAKRLVQLNQFGHADIYRATTENKGLFNGIGAVTLATGNDWRAVEAAGHAFASHTGRYQSLTTWRIAGDFIEGRLTMPITVGTVGGAISAMPQAKRALALMGIARADALRGVILAVGLAQNLAALKAIANGGIQKGHMKMQYRALAIQVGATADEIADLVRQLAATTTVDADVARNLLLEMRK